MPRRSDRSKRTILWVSIRDLEAGSTLVVKEGSITKFYHICEIQIHGRAAKIVYNVPDGLETIHCDADDQVQIRR